MNKPNNSNLVIYQKYLNLIDYTYDLLQKFPKKENFALVTEIKKSLYTGLRYIMYAVKSLNKQNKLKYLNELDVELKLLKVHCRISYKYKYITIQNYNVWSEHITNICNLLGGWIKSCQKQ